MKPITFVVITSWLLFVPLNAQETPLFKKEVFEMNSATMPYRILFPEDYDTHKKYPLILVLHGSGERGNDNEIQLVHGSDLFLKNRDMYRAIVVFPQCSANSSWASISVNNQGNGREFVFYEKAEPTKDMLLLEGLLKYLKKTYAINKRKMYVGGLSMGGFGTFEIVRRNPKLFAAAFPICGGANTAIANRIKNVKWWVFHGADDKVVPPKYSTAMVNALKAVNADIHYSLYPGVGHNSWENAFSEPELLPWLFSFKK